MKYQTINEGIYRMIFEGTVNLLQLNRVRLNHTVVKWTRNIKKKGVTQCRRCQNFGHGSRNCNVAYKCSKCGNSHEMKLPRVHHRLQNELTVEVLLNANNLDCPKRKAFVEMRQKMSTKNHPSRNNLFAWIVHGYSRKYL